MNSSTINLKDNRQQKVSSRHHIVFATRAASPACCFANPAVPHLIPQPLASISAPYHIDD